MNIKFRPVNIFMYPGQDGNYKFSCTSKIDFFAEIMYYYSVYLS